MAANTTNVTLSFHALFRISRAVQRFRQLVVQNTVTEDGGARIMFVNRPAADTLKSVDALIYTLEGAERVGRYRDRDSSPFNGIRVTERRALKSGRHFLSDLRCFYDGDAEACMREWRAEIDRPSRRDTRDGTTMFRSMLYEVRFTPADLDTLFRTWTGVLHLFSIPASFSGCSALTWEAQTIRTSQNEILKKEFRALEALQYLVMRGHPEVLLSLMLGSGFTRLYTTSTLYAHHREVMFMVQP